MKKGTEIHDGYGVLITRDDGTTFLASGGNGVRFFVRIRSLAVAHKRGLMDYGIKNVRVVKLRITYSYYLA